MALRDAIRERTVALRISPKEQAWLEEKFPNLWHIGNLWVLHDLVSLRRSLRQRLGAPRSTGDR